MIKRRVFSLMLAMLVCVIPCQVASASESNADEDKSYSLSVDVVGDGTIEVLGTFNVKSDKVLDIPTDANIQVELIANSGSELVDVSLNGKSLGADSMSVMFSMPGQDSNLVVKFAKTSAVEDESVVETEKTNVEETDVDETTVKETEKEINKVSIGSTGSTSQEKESKKSGSTGTTNIRGSKENKESTSETELSLEDIYIINFIKLDPVTKEPINGVEFTLSYEDGTTEVLTTDAEGQFSLEYLVEGSYTLKETNVPEGYRLLGDLIELNVNKEGYIDLVADSMSDNFSIEVNEGVATITCLAKLDFLSYNLNINVSGGNSSLSGKEYSIFSDIDLTDLVASGTTNLSGVVRFNDLSLGTKYYLVDKYGTSEDSSTYTIYNLEVFERDGDYVFNFNGMDYLESDTSNNIVSINSSGKNLETYLYLSTNSVEEANDNESSSPVTTVDEGTIIIVAVVVLALALIVIDMVFFKKRYK